MVARKPSNKRFVRKNFTIDPELLNTVKIFCEKQNITLSRLLTIGAKKIIIDDVQTNRIGLPEENIPGNPSYIQEIDLKKLDKF